MVTSSLHKLTMNSLYGRFGIKPEMNITEICDQERLDKIMSIYPYGIAEAINNTHYILTYTTQMQQKLRNEDCKDDSFRSMIHWMDSRNAGSSSAVQMSAAITAYARIHMYPYISRIGSYYTDTDSVVLDKPLPPELVSSSWVNLSLNIKK
jgi:hypothetical protein